jgi:hypothetical protein
MKLCKSLMLCLFLEMSGPDPGFVYTGFRWENGWPVAPPPTQPPTMSSTPIPTPLLPPLPPSPMLEVPLTTGPSPDTRITAYNTSNTQVMDLMPQVERDDDQSSEHSEHTGTSYVTSQLTDSEEEGEYEDPKKVKLGNGYC